MFSIAYAMGQSGSPQGAQGGPLGGLMIPMLLMFGIFYFLLIRPQQKQQKERQNMINNLKKDDRVITSGGIYGKIASLDETKVTLEIADKVRIKVLRANIAAIDKPVSEQKENKENKKS